MTTFQEIFLEIFQEVFQEVFQEAFNSCESRPRVLKSCEVISFHTMHASAFGGGTVCGMENVQIEPENKFHILCTCD